MTNREANSELSSVSSTRMTWRIFLIVGVRQTTSIMFSSPTLRLMIDHPGGGGGTIKIWEDDRFYLNIGRYGGVSALDIRDKEYGLYLTVGGKLAEEARGLTCEDHDNCKRICIQAVDRAIKKNTRKFAEHMRLLGQYEGQRDTQAAMRKALGL